VANTVVGPSADAHDLAVLDADVHTAAIGAENAARLNPAFGFLVDPLVDPDRPRGFAVRSTRSPKIFDAVARLHGVLLRFRTSIEAAGGSLGRASNVPLKENADERHRK
jgi:hypothetical protein